MRNFWAGLILGVSLASGWADEPITRIGFGSCYKPEKSTPLWSKVAEFDPQVWLWLGDNVYADVIDGKYIKKDLPKDAFARAYEALGTSEGIATLKKLSPDHLMATWDDHDYGLNDSGKNWERKKDAKKAFAKFWGGEERSDGIYSARDFGPEGKRLRVILLDTRYNRDDPGPSGDILGSRQWDWLEKELSRPGADLVVIGSSIQVLAEQHRFEKWANFPKAKARLWEILRKSGAKGVVFVSGDRHQAEISCLQQSPVGYPIFDITSSGLTEAGSGRDEANELRVGEALHETNFGVLRIEWLSPEPRLFMEIRGADGSVARETSIPLQQLAPPKG
jgi:alkaline phosphatase D